MVIDAIFWPVFGNVLQKMLHNTSHIALLFNLTTTIASGTFGPQGWNGPCRFVHVLDFSGMCMAYNCTFKIFEITCYGAIT